ncbi:Uncharacterized [Syntrophomonas zehnderi OL-4]|uniref:Uncharacterized n=1 Tax=Syntrophomonas zehnderi OL-4 TaxID=690567 RepID=A0A0E3W3M5_9FIRM|nr:hypothetical protein [Syntrophomonas zehnderi]CFX93298.1 Uncharacterized [Syntrophomonas zehnderi OL-4]
MLKGNQVIVRWIFGICCFPVVFVAAIFLLCYSPLYYLFSLLGQDKTKRGKAELNKTRMDGRPRLEVKHA